ncbi:MAG: Grx4 family monothiol glutaredoxin [Gammaproteobacteria bacterium]|nr:Grx4 family monothiol glutaredoxin [Gammaproteobacteria bacterium]MCK5497658.1 Grx4 family monothiol glutaredoxin [Gammaproteobacteria bacterium]MCK5667923.1 Grx4 family monothiol glutaredoxin [Gammaproteobacteria bacterium]
MDVLESIKTVIEENDVIIFMKGSPDAPQCGFSMRTSEALKACNAEFAYVDVLAEPDVRSNLPQYSNWPTFPQVFVKGEFVGGCDIVMEMFQKGELQTMIDATSES